MKNLSAFIDEFGDYLGNADRLPFVCPEYNVLMPALNDDPKKITFRFQHEDKIFGFLSIYYPDRDFLYIMNVNTELGNFEKGPQGFGRELIRRSVMFASDHDIPKIWTSLFLNGAASFWLGLGFKGHCKITPDWHKAGDLQHEKEAWQAAIKESPSELWDMARTDFGKRVLYKTSACGILELNDPVQRNYAFDRLKLSEAKPN